MQLAHTRYCTAACYSMEMAEFERDPYSKRTSFRGLLKRSRSDRVITGLCGGIAKMLGASSRLVRLIAILLAIVTLGTAVLVYFLLSLLVPAE